MYNTIKKPSISVAQNVPSSSSTMIPDTATMYPSPSQAPELAKGQITGLAKGTRETGENVERPMVEAAKIALSPTGVCNAAIQSDQHAQKLATTENAEKSRDSYIETQKMSDTIKEPSSPTKQNVPNSTMISDIGVFAAIFTEVTRILRTTRGCDLTEDDQNYIRECCAALEAVGFDASWLNYVYGCIESCGNGDELIRKLEETEAKASTLRNELASVEVSLASMRDKASRLHNFIES
ncbi:hypothetical protein K1719_016838 [Acacia pycnantha]|nr:hypothetical protein K1719_016838 [Acacia pycnantha]